MFRRGKLIVIYTKLVLDLAPTNNIKQPSFLKSSHTATRRSSGVAPRLGPVCARVRACALVPPNLYILRNLAL